MKQSCLICTILLIGYDLFCFDVFCYSKSTEVIVNSDILEDIQVIEPQIRSSDQKLYEVSQKAMYLFCCK